jgi:hypothetical protein
MPAGRRTPGEDACFAHDWPLARRRVGSCARRARRDQRRLLLPPGPDGGGGNRAGRLDRGGPMGSGDPSIFAELLPSGSRMTFCGRRLDGSRSCAVVLALDRFPCREEERSRTRSQSVVSVGCWTDRQRSRGEPSWWHAHVAGLDWGIWAEGRLRLDPAPQRRGPTIFPCLRLRLRHSSRDKIAGPRRSALRFDPSGAGRSPPARSIPSRPRWARP